jgi:hypothetical protein
MKQEWFIQTSGGGGVLVVVADPQGEVDIAARDNWEADMVTGGVIPRLWFNSHAIVRHFDDCKLVSHESQSFTIG